MRLAEFDYELPEGLIAQYPEQQRDKSRLLVLDRQNRKVEHRFFSDVPYFMEEGDILVLNDTRVIPARLFGKKETGGKVEVLLVKQVHPQKPEGDGGYKVWECLVRSSKRPKVGSRIHFNEYLEGEVTEKVANGKYVVRFHPGGNFEDLLDEVGRIPLPPYIRRDKESRDFQMDAERYQTVFAKNKGAIAAPTAGFHFTEELISRIREKGVKIACITIHIGLGTFMPIRVEDVEDHELEAEYFEIKSEAVTLINEGRSSGKKIIAVGTSTTRALEFVAREEEDHALKEMSGHTNLYIYPGYQFKIVDALLTNFHMPRSTPLLLVSAFAGKALIKDIYQTTVEAGYRFLSYGDGMMIV